MQGVTAAGAGLGARRPPPSAARGRRGGIGRSGSRGAGPAQLLRFQSQKFQNTPVWLGWYTTPSTPLTANMPGAWNSGRP